MYGGTGYQVGARVALRRNSQGERTVDGALVDVANGQLGTVVGIDGHRLVVRLDRAPDVDVVLDDRYLARGGQISHGYALTTHRAQGGTWDLSITVGVDGLYREAAYTDLSRGIAENWLVITDPDITRLAAESDGDLDRHDVGIDPDEDVDIDEDLNERLSTSRAKHLAHSVDPDHGRVDALARGWPLPDLDEQLAIARQATRIATQQHGIDDTRLVQQIATLDHTARHAAVGVSGQGARPAQHRHRPRRRRRHRNRPRRVRVRPRERSPSETCPGNTSRSSIATSPPATSRRPPPTRCSEPAPSWRSGWRRGPTP